MSAERFELVCIATFWVDHRLELLDPRETAAQIAGLYWSAWSIGGKVYEDPCPWKLATAYTVFGPPGTEVVEV